MGWMMQRLAQSACSEDGDMGPEGKNLAKHWHDHADRRMLVAVPDPCATENDKPAIIACCGVKRGVSEKDEAPVTETSFSIWRMSVSAQYRQKGVGRAIMQAAEEWAAAQGGAQMHLVT